MANVSVTIDQAAGQPDPASAGPILFDVQFSEPVTDFHGLDIDFTGSTVGGTLLASVTDNGDGASYTVSVTGMTTEGIVVADVLADGTQDASGNTNFASTSTDNVVTISNGVNDPPVLLPLNPNSGDTPTYT